MLSSLTLDQLRVLVTIADTGSFSAAGRQLSRVQSAISHSVASLEARQGVTVFERLSHRVQLTQTGRVLVEQARLVLGSVARFEAVAAATREGMEAELVIAVDPVVPSEPLIAGVRCVHEVWPQLPVRCSCKSMSDAFQRLRDHEVALALGPLPPVLPKDVDAMPIGEIEFLTVVAPSHPLAKLDRAVSRNELEPHSQVVFFDASPPPAPDFGGRNNTAFCCVDLGRKRDFVRAGFGWCRMPRNLIVNDLAEGRLVVVPLDTDGSRQSSATPICAAYLTQRPPGQVGQRLLTKLRESWTSTE